MTFGLSHWGRARLHSRGFLARAAPGLRLNEHIEEEDGPLVARTNSAQIDRKQSVKR
jgi:hypothetical protein